MFLPVRSPNSNPDLIKFIFKNILSGAFSIETLKMRYTNKKPIRITNFHSLKNIYQYFVIEY